MRFSYKAQKASGELYEAQREAEDKYALARELRLSGETLVFAREEGAGFHFNLERVREALGRVKMHDKIILARNLGGMIGAGLSLSRALSVLERQTRNRKLKKIILSLSERIGKGESLHQALGAFPDVFSPLFASMVKAGEEGGNLSASLNAIAGQLDRSYTLQRKVKGALIYPAVVASVMAIIGVVMFIYVVPKITATFADLHVDLPLSTRAVIWTSDFFKRHLFVGLGALAALALAARFAARSKAGKRAFDFGVLHLPTISPLVKEVNAARLGGTLSSLLSAGVPMVQALEITEDVLPNVYYKKVLASAREAVQKGEPLASVFQGAEHLYPALLSEMVAVGEETGKLSGMLRDTAEFFETEVDQKTKDLSTIIEPLLMVVVGAAVGFFAVAMISPMYSLMGSI